MRLWLSMLSGLICGLIGAAIWAAIVYSVNYEVGYVAWGIGFLVGFGVRWGAGPDLVGLVPGTTAIVLAVGAILLGKFAGVELILEREVGKILAEPIGVDHQMIAIADAVVEDFETTQKPLNWPEGMTLDAANKEQDYPADVWQEAQAKWQAMDESARSAHREEVSTLRVASLKQFRDAMRYKSFRESFGPIDLLWLGLAIATAWKVGSAAATGGAGSEGATEIPTTTGTT